MAPLGSYRVTIEASDGRVLATHEFVSSGHPAVGEELVIDGVVYVVRRVRHEEDLEARTISRYSHAHVFARLAGAPDRAAPPSPTSDSALVLPFKVPREASTSALLPPALVATLVIAGYAQQKIAMRSGWRHLGQLR